MVKTCSEMTQWVSARVAISAGLSVMPFILIIHAQRPHKQNCTPTSRAVGAQGSTSPSWTLGLCIYDFWTSYVRFSLLKTTMMSESCSLPLCWVVIRVLVLECLDAPCDQPYHNQYDPAHLRFWCAVRKTPLALLLWIHTYKHRQIDARRHTSPRQLSEATLL